MKHLARVPFVVIETIGRKIEQENDSAAFGCSSAHNNHLVHEEGNPLVSLAAVVRRTAVQLVFADADLNQARLAEGSDEFSVVLID